MLYSISTVLNSNKVALFSDPHWAANSVVKKNNVLCFASESFVNTQMIGYLSFVNGEPTFVPCKKTFKNIAIYPTSKSQKFNAKNDEEAIKKFLNYAKKTQREQNKFSKLFKL